MQGGAASAGMLNTGGRIEAVATFAGGPQASMQQLAVPMTAAAQSAPVPSTSATPQYTASAAPTAAAAPRTTHVAQHLSGKNLAMMQRSAAPVSVPATAAASAPTAPVVRVDPLHSGKHAGSLPPPRPGVPHHARSGKETALLARGGPPAPTPAPPQPDVLVRAAMASDSENLEHAYPLLQRIAQEFDPSVTLSKAVADVRAWQRYSCGHVQLRARADMLMAWGVALADVQELLKSTTPLIKSVMAFSAQIAKRRTPGTAGTRVTIDDMRLAVGVCAL